ncbi:MAG: ABC transporter permease [Eubacteriales bacterium]|nr:ABC transporter permease [Eubacteriales bacterium]
MLRITKLLKDEQNSGAAEEMKLDDARRVKVLSPSMMVFKRFFRNKLAIVGLCILVVMFAFAFIGPLFSPYDVGQIFTKQSDQWKNYATAQYNAEARFKTVDGSMLQSTIRSEALKVLGKYKDSKTGEYSLTNGQRIEFATGGETYIIEIVNSEKLTPTFSIVPTMRIATISAVGRDKTLTINQPEYVDATLEALLQEYMDTNSTAHSIEYGDSTIIISGDKAQKNVQIYANEPIALATFNVFFALQGKTADLQSDLEFIGAVETAIANEAETVTYNDVVYTLATDDKGATILSDQSGQELFNIRRIYRSNPVEIAVLDDEGNAVTYVNADEKTVPMTESVSFVSTIEDIDAFYVTLNAAIKELQEEFEFEGADYTISYEGADPEVFNAEGVSVMNVSDEFAVITSKYDLLSDDFHYILACEYAIANGETVFTYNEEEFTLVTGEFDTTVINAAGEEIGMVSDIIMGAEEVGTELTVNFRLSAQEAIRSHAASFDFVDQFGVQKTARLNIVNTNYYLEVQKDASLLRMREEPTIKHLLGTDVNGMDVTIRLMQGGQVSLLVGFVVVFFEMIIGIIVGGFSGYFGGWVDTLLMRFVDLFNALPFYPIVIILGSLMDDLQLGGWPRIMALMVVLGILSWTGIARVVRGQILSLREQDFMVATEATGIRTTRKIFKHLVPNVMPLLIVQATMGLGGIILTEATLGYLGLGVQYPMASWGSIVNQATDMQIMRTAWWIWVPAGFLILITVLGFNFVGDGLRDAFDPKMKR